MKTYALTITGLRPKDVLPLLESLPSHASLSVTNIDQPEVVEDTKPPRTNGNAILSMTGKRASKGSVREQVLTVFEKLEKKHGIGAVNRKMLRDDCNKKGVDSQIIYQLLRDGYLKVLT